LVVEGEEVGEDLLGGEVGWPAVGCEDGFVEGAVGAFEPGALSGGAEVRTGGKAILVAFVILRCSLGVL
jgi:hypothetical protein